MPDEQQIFGLPPFDPALLPKALDYYSAILRGKKVKNPHGFPTDPSELIEDISETAFAVGQLPQWSTRIKKETKTAMAEVQKENPVLSPSVESFLADVDTVTGQERFKNPSAKKLQEMEELLTQATREYEPVPKNADSLETTKTAMRIVGEASALAALIKAKEWNIDQAMGSQEFRKYQQKFEKDIDEDAKKLASDPVFQRYVKDFPIFGNGMMMAMTGLPVTASVISLTEATTFAMIAADDPDVKRHAFNLRSLSGEEQDVEMQKLMQAAEKRITKAIFSREVRQRRMLPDIVFSAALTSPAFLKSVGLPADLPQNLLWDGIKGVGHAATNLRTSMKGTIAEDFVNFFRDKSLVRSEKLQENLYAKVKSYLGPKTGDEIVAGMKARVDAELERMSGGVAKLEGRASQLYSSFQDQIRSKFVGMTPEEQAAAIMRHQNIRAMAPPEVDAVWDNPAVVRASKFVTSLVRNLARVDNLPIKSTYFPAFRAHIETTMDALRIAAMNPHLRKREVIDSVVPIVVGTDQITGKISYRQVSRAIDDLVFRTITPTMNDLLTKTSKDAESAAALILSEIDEVISNPVEKLALIKQAMIEVPINKRGAIGKAISNVYNTFMLTARWPAWMKSEAMDGVVESTANLLERVKQGKAVDFSDLFSKAKAPAEIVSDTVAHPLARDNSEPWRMVASWNAVNDLAFKGNKMFDNFRAEKFFQFNFGSAKADIAKKAGIAVEQLNPAQIELATREATDATRRFALSYSHASAMTTNTATTALFPYLGFWIKSQGRFIQDFGSVPELYKAISLGKAKIEEMNREYPSEWRSAVLNVGGFGLNVFNPLAYYPWISAMKDSYFGPIEDKTGQLKKDADAIRVVAEKDPDKAWKMVQNSSGELLDYFIQEPSQSMARFFSYIEDTNFVPLGPPARWAAERAKLIDERSTFWFPGGKAFENLFRGLGLYEPNKFNNALSNLGSIVGRPELTVGLTLGQLNPGAITARMRAYNENKWDADMQIQYLNIVNRENIDEAKLSEPERAALRDRASKEIRVGMLENFFASQILGMSNRDLPHVQEYWNGLSESFNRMDLIVPTNDQIEKMAADTGIEDTRVLYEVWRKTWPGLLEMERGGKASEARFDFLENFPGLSDFQQIQATRRMRDVEAGVRKNREAWGRIPYRSGSSFMPFDRHQRAFIQMLSSKAEYDEEGTVKGLKIELRDPNGRGAALMRHVLKSPDEKIQSFIKGDPDIAIVQQLWPTEYAKVSMAAVGKSETNIPPPEDETGIRYVMSPAEEDLRSDKTHMFWDSIKEYVPSTPLEFPAHAARVFTSGNEAQIKEYVEKGGRALLNFATKAAGAVGRLLVSDAGAYEMTPEERRQVQSAITNPKDSVEEANKGLALDFIRENINGKDLRKKSEAKKAMQAYKDFYGRAPAAGEMVKLLEPQWMHLYQGVGRMSEGKGFNADLFSASVGESLNDQYWDWKSRVRTARASGTATLEEYKQLIQEGTVKDQQGLSFIDAMERKNPQTVQELKLLSKGYKYRFGFTPWREFPDDQVTTRKIWSEVAFQRPDETFEQYEARTKTTIADPAKVPEITATQIKQYMRENNQSAELLAFNQIRNKQYAKIPIDAGGKMKIDSFRNFVQDNIEDVPVIAEAVRRDPEVIAMMKNHDKRSYKSLEKVLYGDVDRSALNYMQASGYSPESIGYVQRINPNTFSRIFNRNSDFQSVAIAQGFQDTLGPNVDTVMAGLINPEPLMPDPVPEGTFSSLPNTLQYMTRRARTQAAFLNNVPRERLTEEEIAFIDSEPSAQVFQTFPGVIGQAFREGKLGPREVIGQLRGIADYGRLVGALDEEQHNSFTSFLDNSSNVFGATQFGFRLGQFLDDTFNTPRIPIQNPFIDFALAGGPVSGGAPFQPGERIRLPVSPVLVGSARDPFPSLGPLRDISGVGEAARPDVTGAAAAVAGGASTATGALGVGAAAGGLPPLGAVFGVISAGFTIANLGRSRRARRRARGDAERQRQDAERRRLEAMREAEVVAEENLRRQLAAQRQREFDRLEQERQRDFQIRADRFLKSGANFATFAQQPQEFRNRFIDRFEPEFIEFTRRPQFPSRLNLIESVQGRLPRVRF